MVCEAMCCYAAATSMDQLQQMFASPRFSSGDKDVRTAALILF